MKRVNFETEKAAKATILREVIIKAENIKEETGKAVKLHVELAENIDNLKKSFDDDTLKEYFRVLFRDAEIWVPKAAIQEKDEKIAVEKQVGGRIRQIMQPTGNKITVVADWFLTKNRLYITDVK